MRFLVAAAASLLLMLALAAPVAARGSCASFGAETARWTQEVGGIGPIISSLAPTNSLLGPGTRISGIVLWEHSWMCGG